MIDVSVLGLLSNKAMSGVGRTAAPKGGNITMIVPCISLQTRLRDWHLLRKSDP